MPTWHCAWLLKYYCLYSLCCTMHPHNYFGVGEKSEGINLIFIFKFPKVET